MNQTPKKTALLKPHVLRSIVRLTSFIRHNAPAVVIGNEAWLLFRTILACYGASAGRAMVDYLVSESQGRRGVCTHGDCINDVDRPDTSAICEPCAKELGVDDETLDKLFSDQDGGTV